MKIFIQETSYFKFEFLKRNYFFSKILYQLCLTSLRQAYSYVSFLFVFSGTASGK